MITIRQAATTVTVHDRSFTCEDDPGHADFLNGQEWDVPGWHPSPDYFLAEKAIQMWGGEITKDDGRSVRPSVKGRVY